MATPQLHGWYDERGDDWQSKANCIGVDPDLYFPDKGDAEVCYAQTRPICSVCVVRDECREYALVNRMDSGMWGGMTANELRRERRRRHQAVKRGEIIEGWNDGGTGGGVTDGQVG